LSDKACRVFRDALKFNNSKRNRYNDNDSSNDVIIEMEYKGKSPCKPDQRIDSVPVKIPATEKLCILSDTLPIITDEPDTLKNKGRNDPPDLSNNDLLVVYPNPSKGIYSVIYTTEKITDISISVYDIDSKLILNESWGKCEGKIEKQISLEGKAPGTYYLILNTGAAHYSQKLIKQ